MDIVHNSFISTVYLSNYIFLKVDDTHYPQTPRNDNDTHEDKDRDNTDKKKVFTITKLTFSVE